MKDSLVKDCVIEFEEAVYVGKYPKAKFSHTRKIKGKILKESYGKEKNQHTFTILVVDSDSKYLINSKILRKGRNIYPTLNIIEYPENYKELCEEKENRKLQIKNDKR